MTATLHDTSGRHVLRFERRLRHGVDRVWQAVTDPAELAQWFPSTVRYEPRAGAPMRFVFEGHGIELDGEVVEYDPPRAFAFAWGEDELRFELTPDGDGCLLVFTHAFAPEPGKPARDAAGWDVCLEAFEAVLDGGRPADPDESRWSQAYEAEVERLGGVTITGELGWRAARKVRLFGPKTSVDGRDALAAHLVPRPPGGEDPVVLVARDGRLADGVSVEVRAGTPQEPGATLAIATLHDGARPSRG